MIATRVNPRYLTEFRLPDRVTPVARPQAALQDAKLVVFAVPSHGLRAVARAVAPSLPSAAVLISATKGLETDSLQRMSMVLGEEATAGQPVVVLSGPSFASEVARGLPTAVLSASRDAAAAAYVQEQFRGPALRLYVSDDVAGVEIGGAMKNVIAIASGVVEGLGLGTQRDGRAHHARAGRDLAARGRRGRPPRDAGWFERPRRSGPDFDRRSRAGTGTSGSSSDAAVRSRRSSAACA